MANKKDTKNNNKEAKKEVVKFDIETAVIAALDVKYGDITKITDGKSKQFVMNGLREYRELRLSVVEGHKKEKEEALAYCNFLDAEKRRILERIEPGESYLKEVRQEYENKKEEEKREKERIEQERVSKIRKKISGIQSMTLNLSAMTSKDLKELREDLGQMEINEEEFMEFTEEAQDVFDHILKVIKEAIPFAEQREKEEIEHKEKKARLEKERKEIEEKNRELEEKKKQLEKEEFEKQERAKIAAQLEEERDKVERERVAKEEAETEARAKEEELKPDKEKILGYINILEDTQVPVLKTENAKDLMNQIAERLIKLIRGARYRAANL